MTTSLASKYRPQTFDDFVGSELTVLMFRKMLATNTLPPCLVLSGRHGTGKTSAARILSSEINSSSTGNDLSFIEIDAASNSGVDNIRSLREQIRYSHSGNWRVVCLDEAHMLSTSAFNALLKTLEDPPPRTSFILATTKPEAIPDTIHSRAMSFRINPIPVNDIAKRLIHVIQQEGFPTRDAKVIMRIATVAQGSMRNALFLLQQLQLTDTQTVETVDILSGQGASTKDLLYAMLSGDVLEVEVELSSLQEKQCDVIRLVETLASDINTFFDSRILTSKQYLKSMEVLWSMRKLDSGSESRLRMQFEAGIFALFSQCFWNGEEGKVKEEEVATSEDLASFS